MRSAPPIARAQTGRRRANEKFSAIIAGRGSEAIPPEKGSAMQCPEQQGPAGRGCRPPPRPAGPSTHSRSQNKDGKRPVVGSGGRAVPLRARRAPPPENRRRNSCGRRQGRTLYGRRVGSARLRSSARPALASQASRRLSRARRGGIRGAPWYLCQRPRYLPPCPRTACREGGKGCEGRGWDPRLLLLCVACAREGTTHARLVHGYC